MCQRQSDDLPLLHIKKQLEELWHTTELLICILSRNCKATKDSLKPIVKDDQRSTSALPDSIVLSEHLEEKLCEKIDQVISFTHSVVEKSKGCLITIDSRLQNESVNSKTGPLRQTENMLAKDTQLTPKAKDSARIRKSNGQCRADFLRTTYGSAFAKAKRHSSNKSSKSTKICVTSHHSKSIDCSAPRNEKIAVDRLIFKDIDELIKCGTSGSNGGAVGGDPVQEKTRIEHIKTSSTLEEALKNRLIEPHSELIHYVSSYQRSLDQLSRLTEYEGNIHKSRFLQELQKRNEMYSASCEDSRRELQRCFSIIEKCPILTFGIDISSSINTCKLPVMLFKYNNFHKWLDLETMKLESFFWKQHLILLKSIEADTDNLISVENKAALLKTLTSLTSIVANRN